MVHNGSWVNYMPKLELDPEMLMVTLLTGYDTGYKMKKRNRTNKVNFAPKLRPCLEGLPEP